MKTGIEAGTDCANSGLLRGFLQLRGMMHTSKCQPCPY